MGLAGADPNAKAGILIVLHKEHSWNPLASLLTYPQGCNVLRLYAPYVL